MARLNAAEQSLADRSTSIVPFAAVSAAYFAHIGFFNPYLPLWLQSLGQPLWAIAVLTSVQSFTRMFMPYVWGWLGDHTGRPVWCMRIGAAFALLGGAVLALYQWLTTPSFLGLALALLLLFMPTSAIIPTSEALLTQRMQVSGQSFDAHRYGRMRMWGSMGFLLTVLFAGSLFEWLGMQAFTWVALLSLVGVGAAVWSLPQMELAKRAAGEALPPVWPVLRQTENLWLFLSLFLHVLAHAGLYFFFSLWLDSQGYSKSTIGALWALGVAVEIATLFWQGPWLARLSWVGWLVLCGLACALRMGVIAWGAGSLLLVAAAQCLHGLSFATHHTAVMALLSERAPAALLGRFQALYAVIGYGLSGVIGGAAGALLSQHWGLKSVFLACAVVALLAAWASSRAVGLHRAEAIR